MPTYDYGCVNCKHEWECFHKLSEPGPSACPACGSEPKRLISAVFGKVELNGRELQQKVKDDVRKIKHEAETSEKTLANLVGETKYQDNVVSAEKISKDFGSD